ncbi:hypothetical protein HQQ81_10345 [Microbacteriaceae bacterium VKM Ac-2854]|nr:hypothetical protein [Microbacteriaceae bacterium VKM Ac-2854]
MMPRKSRTTRAHSMTNSSSSRSPAIAMPCRAGSRRSAMMPRMKPTLGTRTVKLKAIETSPRIIQVFIDANMTVTDGEYSGYLQRSLRSYGREGKPCDRCRTPIVREPFMNRSSFYCPRCQRVERIAS